MAWVHKRWEFVATKCHIRPAPGPPFTLDILEEKPVKNENIETELQKEDILEMESYSDSMEDISGDDDKSDGDWTPDKFSKEEKLIAGTREYIHYPIYFLTAIINILLH